MAEKLKRRSCSLCGKDNSRLFHILRTNNFDIEYVTCNKCGFIFQSKPFSNKELKDYYSHQYRKTDIKNGTPTERVLSTERARAKLVSAFLICHSIENFNFALDIGCSTGSLLKELQSISHAKVVGIEPGEIYRHYAQKNKLEIYPSMEKMKKKVHSKFDLITMMHVLEHLDDPCEFLKALYSDWLAEKGTLVIEVPNTYSHDSFEVPHISAFTPHTFREMLVQARFHVDVLEKHGRPRSKIFPLYMTVIVHPMGKTQPGTPIHPERFVVAKRKIGMTWRRVVQKLVPTLSWQTPELVD